MQLTEAISKVLNTAGEYTTESMETVVNTLRHNGSYWELGRTRVEPQAMEQLVKDRLAGFPGLLHDESLSTKFLQDYINLKAAALPSHRVTVKHGQTIKAFLPESHAEYTNPNVVQELGNMWVDGLLPQDTEVHRFHISPDGSDMFMRLVSRQWNMGDYFGGLAVSNQELKDGMKVRPAVAKVSCFNWVLKENIYRPEDRSAVRPVLETGLNMITTFANEGIIRMAQMDGIKLDHVDVLFDLVASELKLPENVKSEMYKYWVKGGSGRSVNDVLQAVTWGVQALTDNTGRRQPKWDARERLEENIWAWTGEMMELHSTGVNLDEHIANRELVKKSKVLEALRVQNDPASYVRRLAPDGFAKS